MCYSECLLLPTMPSELQGISLPVPFSAMKQMCTFFKSLSPRQGPPQGCASSICFLRTCLFPIPGPRWGELQVLLSGKPLRKEVHSPRCYVTRGIQNTSEKEATGSQESSLWSPWSDAKDRLRSLGRTQDSGNLHNHQGFSGGTMVNNLPAKAGDAGDKGSTPGSGRSLGERNGYPLHFSSLENSMGRA